MFRCGPPPSNQLQGGGPTMYNDRKKGAYLVGDPRQPRVVGLPKCWQVFTHHVANLNIYIYHLII